MKTASLIVSVAALVLVMATQQADAQYINHPDPCTPCKQAVLPWGNAQLIQKLVTIGECTYTVTYRKRVCNSDGCQELKLETVRLFAGTDCAGDSTSEIITLLLGKMITENTMGFLPDSVSQGSNGCWRIIRPACWKFDSTRCSTWPPTGEFDPDSLRYNYGDILPCDTSDCCTNVIYPTRDNCGNILFDTPDKTDLPWLHGLRNNWSGEDSASRAQDSIEYYDAKNDFSDQYNTSMFPTCRECYPSSGSPPTSPKCRRQCPEDIIVEYKRLLNERLKRKY
ncbi:MAG: hypothetical protein KA339_00105 [Candidatus Kapabacteria bacterium]|nr:hypothetical protein [Ignavibacteria bacterium]MBK6420200.1 hypothetical protein [Ignavibacteria bacterium]MBK7412851.1 hypothetical protein [Ignavibacteria bacterium]MBP6508929.1 hypothetical protein [Candidatus Kapabacteria bacterium]